MNIFGVQSHLYKKIGGDSIVLIFVVPNRAGNRYDNNVLKFLNIKIKYLLKSIFYKIFFFVIHN